MNLITLIILINLGFFVALLTVCVIIFWKDLMAFFNPSDWCTVTMIELDNNVRTWLQKKDESLRFEFRGAKYNLFDAITKKKRIPLPNGQYKEIVTKGTNVYRAGRLSRFFYIEGNEDPINFKDRNTSIDAKIKQQLFKIDMSALFQDTKTGFDNFLDIMKPVMIVGAILLIIYLITKQPPQSPT